MMTSFFIAPNQNQRYGILPPDILGQRVFIGDYSRKSDTRHFVKFIPKKTNPPRPHPNFKLPAIFWQKPSADKFLFGRYFRSNASPD